LQEHIGFADEMPQRGAAIGRGQIGESGELAASGVLCEPIDEGQMRGRNTHDIGAMGGKRAAGDRTGDDARQIEHAKTRERSCSP
jgi:hypothetical protein